MTLRVDPARTSALIVGVGGYDHQPWNINGPAATARDVYHYLLTKRHIPDARIRVLISEELGGGREPEPTSEAVNTALNDLSLDDGDLLLVFWSGHGAIDLERRERLFFSDATEHDPRNLELRDALAAFASNWCDHFPRQLWIVDACAIPMTRSLEFDTPGTRLPKGTNAPRSQALLFGTLLHQTSRPGTFWPLVRAELEAQATASATEDDLSQWPDIGSFFHALQARFNATGENQSPRVDLCNWDGSIRISSPGHLASSWLLRGEREEASKIVDGANLDLAIIRPHYLAALKVVQPAPEARADAVTFSECLNHLALLVSCRPMLALARSLATRLLGNSQQRLQEWCDQVAHRLDVDLSLLPKLEKMVLRSVPEEATLLIQIRPAAAPVGHFSAILTAWLWTVGGYEQYPEYPRAPSDSEDPLSLEELRATVPALVQRVRANLPPGEVRLTVEVMVPLELLSEEFDAWLMHDGPLTIPLGTSYPLLLRSLERIERPAYSDRWLPRWKQLRLVAHDKVVDRMCWIRPGAMQPQDMLASLDATDEEVCVGILFPPGDEPWVHCAIFAGIPAVLWLRRKNDNLLQVHAYLCAQLGDSTIEALPNWILKARRRAAAGAEHNVLRHIAVLWDDPDREVPDPGPPLHLD